MKKHKHKKYKKYKTISSMKLYNTKMYKYFFLFF